MGRVEARDAAQCPAGPGTPRREGPAQCAWCPGEKIASDVGLGELLCSLAPPLLAEPPPPFLPPSLSLRLPEPSPGTQQGRTAPLELLALQKDGGE
jgi:hypothetical protein